MAALAALKAARNVVNMVEFDFDSMRIIMDRCDTNLENYMIVNSVQHKDIKIIISGILEGLKCMHEYGI